MTLQPRHAASIIFSFSVFSIFYHVLILAGIIPMQMTWGGRITTFQELVWMESISISINLVIAAIVSGYMGIIPLKFTQNRYRLIFLFLAILFAVNTLGNLFSDNELEKLIFTPVTAILSWLFFRISPKTHIKG